MEIQLLPVAGPELLPFGRIVAEPLPELVAWSDLLQPLVDPRFILRHAPRPETVDEDPSAVVGPDRVVNPFYSDHVVFPPGRPCATAPSTGNSGELAADSNPYFLYDCKIYFATSQASLSGRSFMSYFVMPGPGFLMYFTRSSTVFSLFLSRSFLKRVFSLLMVLPPDGWHDAHLALKIDCPWANAVAAARVDAATVNENTLQRFMGNLLLLILSAGMSAIPLLLPCHSEGFQDILGDRLRILVGNGLFIKLGHAATGVAHVFHDVFGVFDPVGLPVGLLQGLLGIDDVSAVRMAYGTVFLELLGPVDLLGVGEAARGKSAESQHRYCCNQTFFHRF